MPNRRGRRSVLDMLQTNARSNGMSHRKDHVRDLRERQAHIMRWIIFVTAQLMGIGSLASVMIHGATVSTAALSIPAITIFWLVRTLFGPGPAGDASR